MIDLYAERTAPGLLNEPFNTVTNLAFIVAAWAAWRYARKENACRADILVLIGLIAAIGLGSATFHMFATRWALLLDVVPIVLFLLTYLWVYTRTVMRVPIAATLGLIVIYFASTYAALRIPLVFRRSAGYIPVLLFLSGLGTYHCLRMRRERWLLLAAAGVFTLSLTFRSIDYAAAAYLPMGSHFMWHILNGVTLYLTEAD
jgi:hypothetical protein